MFYLTFVIRYVETISDILMSRIITSRVPRIIVLALIVIEIVKSITAASEQSVYDAISQCCSFEIPDKGSVLLIDYLIDCFKNCLCI